MKSVVLLIIILKCVVCKEIQCYVCEAEKTDLGCRDPTDDAVRNSAVYCSADVKNNVCSTTSYKRKCRDGGRSYSSTHF